MKRILVAVDGSEGACRAAHFAGALARETGATLELINVYDAPAAAQLGMRALSKTELKVKHAEIANGSFRAALGALGERAPELHLHRVLGHPAQEICVRAEESEADLIVMGSRGLSPFRAVLLGSVSARVLQHAKCPVTIVR